MDKEMKKRRFIKVCGYNVEVCQFSTGSFYYPVFNGNAEFKVSSKGFRRLSSYLRTVRYLDNLIINVVNKHYF